MEEKRFRILIAVFLVLFKDNKVLLQRRKNTGYRDGNYGLVSGHLDGNESATEALIREAREEAGIILEAKDLVFKHAMHNISSGKEYLYLFFTASKWRGKPKILEPEKCDDLSWFDLDNLPTNIIGNIRKAIFYTQNGILYSELGFKNKTT